MRVTAATSGPAAPRSAPRRPASDASRTAPLSARAAALASAAMLAWLLVVPQCQAQGLGVPPAGNAGGLAPPSAPAASDSAASNADGHDFPRRRAGLWEIETVGANAAGLPAARYCIDDTTDRASLNLDRSSGVKGSCRLGAFRRAGDAWSAETICRQGRTSVVSRSVASGDFETAYRIDTVIQYDPPLGGVIPRESTAIRGRWIGPCSAGQRAGDVSIPGMGRLNMKDGTVVPEEPAEPRKAAKPRRTTRPADG